LTYDNQLRLNTSIAYMDGFVNKSADTIVPKGFLLIGARVLTKEE
jgi:hypothetical protein